jgi:hypothetical protein
LATQVVFWFLFNATISSQSLADVVPATTDVCAQTFSSFESWALMALCCVVALLPDHVSHILKCDQLLTGPWLYKTNAAERTNSLTVTQQVQQIAQVGVDDDGERAFRKMAKYIDSAGGAGVGAGMGGAYASDSNHSYALTPLGSAIAEASLGSDEADDSYQAGIASPPKAKKDAKGYSEFTSIVASDAPSVGGAAPFSI